MGVEGDPQADETVELAKRLLSAPDECLFRQSSLRKLHQQGQMERTRLFITRGLASLINGLRLSIFQTPAAQVSASPSQQESQSR